MAAVATQMTAADEATTEDVDAAAVEEATAGCMGSASVDAAEAWRVASKVVRRVREAV